MIVERPNGGRLQVSAECLGVMERFRQLKPSDAEAGGMLIGRLIEDSDDVVVDEVSTPTFWDIRRRFWFFRWRQPAQKKINVVWRKSGGTRIYLGEWHTHPENSPTPSSIDTGEWARLCLETRRSQSFLFFAIVGLVEVRVWEMAAGGTPALLSPPKPDNSRARKPRKKGIK